jgi:hypothetical protein
MVLGSSAGTCPWPTERTPPLLLLPRRRASEVRMDEQGSLDLAISRDS